MDINLFEHNMQAYKAAVAMMDARGKAAVIHPTGTGKSMIAFQLAADNQSKKICWLAPSSYIYETQLENLRSQSDAKTCDASTKNSKDESEGEISKSSFGKSDTQLFSNITFISYSMLMHNEEMIDDLKPEYIVLDEFHRCGARMWGKSVTKLLNAYPDAKVLGLTATNIRYLDNQRDMALELFDGCIASEMTLAEAIARGILTAPKYVSALYSYSNEIKKLEKRLDDLKKENKRKRSRRTENAAENIATRNNSNTDRHSKENRAYEKSEKLLEDLKRALEQADGPREIFAKYMTRPHGKYIVFCSGREHMSMMQELAGKWFADEDEHPHVYCAYYDDPATSKAFKEFRADDSDHLRLLYCIDMLNEGVHVKDIDGVILLRPTVSPIIYMQQIGRALSAAVDAANTDKTNNSDTVDNTDTAANIDNTDNTDTTTDKDNNLNNSRSWQPIIFDLVDNFESLDCIDFLEREVDEAFEQVRENEPSERERFKGKFQIIDETKDCRRFSRLFYQDLLSLEKSLLLYGLVQTIRKHIM